MQYEEKKLRAETAPHHVILEGRESLSVSGVEEVESFDEERIELRTVKGRLTISGEGLHIGRLSLETGELSAEGALSGLQYEDGPPGQGGFWARLFG